MAAPVRSAVAAQPWPLLAQHGTGVNHLFTNGGPLSEPGAWGLTRGLHMLEKIAWGLSKFAFDAAQDRRFAVLMRRAFRRLGTLSFRLAFHLEGRALAAICEGSAKGARLGALKGGLTTLGKHCLWRFSSPAAGTGGNLLPLVQAWSLPNLPQLQKLGLGPVWAVAVRSAATSTPISPVKGCGLRCVSPARRPRPMRLATPASCRGCCTRRSGGVRKPGRSCCWNGHGTTRRRPCSRRPSPLLSAGEPGATVAGVASLAGVSWSKPYHTGGKPRR